MSTTPTAPAAQSTGDGSTPTPQAPAAQATPAEPTSTSPAADEAALGDAGKKALDAMKDKWHASRDEAAKFKADLEELRAKVDGKEKELASERERAAVEAAALSKANERILAAEIRAAAAGKLNDPADALRYLDTAKFEVSDDGSVDSAAIAAAITDLISSKPYLAVQDGTRFQGGADGGPRNGVTPLTASEQISAAEAAGDWTTARQLKAASLANLKDNQSANG